MRRSYVGKDEEGIYTGKLPRELSREVSMICADYGRRAEEIRKGRLRRQVLSNYARINAAVDGALRTVFRGEDERMIPAMRRDIGYGAGYIRCESKAWMSSGMFYRRKRWCKREIAERLSLI